MKKIASYRIFEKTSVAKSQIDLLSDAYVKKSEVANKYGDAIGKYDLITVKVIDPEFIKFEKPEWSNYIGSHHWGKKTDYIPEYEIWVVKGLNEDRFRKLINHEIIEREMMRALEEEQGMDRQTAWEQAHYYVKQMGF
jgi:hypothetical protein